MLFVATTALLIASSFAQRARITTLHMWDRPVEDLSAVTFHDVLPHQGDTPSNQGIDRFHMFLMIYEDQCIDDTSNPVFEAMEYRTGPDFENFRIAESLDAKYLVNVLNEWTRSNVVFKNKSGRKLNQLWWNKDETANGVLEVDDESSSGTFLGHMFLWRDFETNEVVNMVVVDDFDMVYEIREMDQCKREHITDPDECAKAKEKFAREEAYEFWAKQREALNWLQPKLFPNFTEMGFAKTRLPEHLFQRIQDWYHAHEPDPKTTPSEYLAGPVLNQLDSPTFMAHLQQPERQALEEYFRPVLEEWSGLSPLKMTSLYGIRKYTNGACLGMHCDTCTTHVISAIINVDQHVNEDWPLQIYDPLGKMHSLTMKAGDVVFYESATANHARQVPMNGTDYSNIFIHFRPTDNSRWNCDWF